MRNNEFIPEQIVLEERIDIINCPHCGLTVSIKGQTLKDGFCPHCNNAISKDHFIRREYLSVPKYDQLPIKCLNCNFEFITNTYDFYYKPGNIECPKCKIQLTRESVINVYKNFVEEKRNKKRKEEKYAWLGVCIFIILFTLPIWILVLLFS